MPEIQNIEPRTYSGIAITFGGTVAIGSRTLLCPYLVQRSISESTSTESLDHNQQHYIDQAGHPEFEIRNLATFLIPFLIQVAGIIDINRFNVALHIKNQD